MAHAMRRVERVAGIRRGDSFRGEHADDDSAFSAVGGTLDSLKPFPFVEGDDQPLLPRSETEPFSGTPAKTPAEVVGSPRQQVAVYALSRDWRQYRSVINQSRMPFTFTPRSYSFFLLNVDLTVTNKVLYPMRTHWEDVDFNEECERKGLAVVKCHTIFHAKQNVQGRKGPLPTSVNVRATIMSDSKEGMHNVMNVEVEKPAGATIADLTIGHVRAQLGEEMDLEPTTLVLMHTPRFEFNHELSEWQDIDTGRTSNDYQDAIHTWAEPIALRDADSLHFLNNFTVYVYVLSPAANIPVHVANVDGNRELGEYPMSEIAETVLKAERAFWGNPADMRQVLSPWGFVWWSEAPRPFVACPNLGTDKPGYEYKVGGDDGPGYYRTDDISHIVPNPELLFPDPTGIVCIGVYELQPDRDFPSFGHDEWESLPCTTKAQQQELLAKFIRREVVCDQKKKVLSVQCTPDELNEPELREGMMAAAGDQSEFRCGDSRDIIRGALEFDVLIMMCSDKINQLFHELSGEIMRSEGACKLQTVWVLVPFLHAKDVARQCKVANDAQITNSASRYHRLEHDRHFIVADPQCAHGKSVYIVVYTVTTVEADRVSPFKRKKARRLSPDVNSDTANSGDESPAPVSQARSRSKKHVITSDSEDDEPSERGPNGGEAAAASEEHPKQDEHARGIRRNRSSQDSNTPPAESESKRPRVEVSDGTTGNSDEDESEQSGLVDTSGIFNK